MKRTLTSIGMATALIGFLLPLAFEGNSDAQARSFRSDDRIAAPPTKKKGKSGAPLGRLPANIVAVDPQVVRKAIHQIAAAWSGRGLGQYLDKEKFYDKRRLLDAIARDVPRGAKIRVLTIGGINTLSQRREKRPDGIYVISTVQASVSLQIEFIHPQSGFQRLRGRNEWTLRVVSKKPVMRALGGPGTAPTPGTFVPAPWGRGVRGHVIDIPLPCGRAVNVRAAYNYSPYGEYRPPREFRSRFIPVMIGRYVIYVDGRRVGRGQFKSQPILTSRSLTIPGIHEHSIPSGTRCWAVVNFKIARRVQRKVVDFQTNSSSSDSARVWGFRQIAPHGTLLSLELVFVFRQGCSYIRGRWDCYF